MGLDTTIPGEIWICVFRTSILSTHDISLCRLVCRRFNGLISSNELWKRWPHAVEVLSTHHCVLVNNAQWMYILKKWISYDTQVSLYTKQLSKLHCFRYDVTFISGSDFRLTIKKLFGIQNLFGLPHLILIDVLRKCLINRCDHLNECYYITRTLDCLVKLCLFKHYTTSYDDNTCSEKRMFALTQWMQPETELLGNDALVSSLDEFTHQVMVGIQNRNINHPLLTGQGNALSNSETRQALESIKAIFDYRRTFSKPLLPFQQIACLNSILTSGTGHRVSLGIVFKLIAQRICLSLDFIRATDDEAGKHYILRVPSFLSDTIVVAIENGVFVIRSSSTDAGAEGIPDNTINEEFNFLFEVRQNNDDMLSFRNAAQRCSLYVEDETMDEMSPADRTRSKQQFNSVKYSVGMILRHKRYNYMCVIYGWDPVCTANEGWQIQMRVHDLPNGINQPFYHVLVDDGSSRYAAEENLLFEPKPIEITHNDIGRYFKQFSKTHYRMADIVAEVYAEDCKATNEYVNKVYSCLV